MNVALDSSVLVALLNPNDVLHSRALALQAAVAQAGPAVIYFDCVGPSRLAPWRGVFMKKDAARKLKSC